MLQWFKKKKERTTDKHLTGDPRWEYLESILGFHPGEEQELFERALRHRSIIESEEYEKHETYERLEFLGDAVLDLIVTEIIYKRFPSEDEGFLTKLRAKLVRGDTLAELALQLNLNKILEIGTRVQGQGIELSKSVLSDIFESLIAATYLTKGYSTAYRFVESVLEDQIDLNEMTSSLDNYKSLLLEYTQAEKRPLPHYRIVSEDGPGHDKTFHVSVTVDNVEYGRGSGKSKKQAEQYAAEMAYRELKNKESSS